MESFEVGRDVAVVVVEDGVALALPPEPVLHHDIHGDVFGAVAVGDGEDLIERGVAILGLDEAVGPAGKHGSVTGEVAVLVDDVVHLGAVEDEVVDAVAGDGVKGELEGEAVVDVGVGCGVPDDAVAFGGEEKGDGYVGVVLG